MYARAAAIRRVARVHAFARAVLARDTPVAAIGFLHHAMIFWSLLAHATRVGAPLRRRVHPAVQRAHAVACLGLYLRALYGAYARADLAAAARVVVAVAA